MKFPMSVLFLTGLLASCAQKPISTSPSTPQVPSAAHLVRVDFNGVGTDHLTSQAQVLGTSGFSKQGPQTVVGSLQFTSLSTQSFTVKREGKRYLTATYRVTNNTGRTLLDLGLIGVALNDIDGDASNNAVDPTVQNTVFTHVKHFDGSTADSTATSLIPGTTYDYDYQTDTAVLEDSGTTFRQHLDLSDFTPVAPAGLSMDVQNFGWFLEGNFAPGTSRVLTFSVSFPMAPDPRDDPYSFSFMAGYGESYEPTQFVTLGDQVNEAPDVFSAASIAMDKNNKPVVAYTQFDPYIGVTSQVRAWNGSAWESYPTPFDHPTEFATDPIVRLTPTDHPVVMALKNESDGFSITLRRWTGSTWEDLGKAATLDAYRMNLYPDVMQMVVDSTGEPVVAYLGVEVGAPSNSLELHVVKHQTGGWDHLDGALNQGSNHDMQEPSLALDSSDQPVVTWTEAVDGVSRDVWVKRWNGTGWTQLGGALDINQSKETRQASIIVDQYDRPVVAWSEQDPGDGLYNVYVKRWNGTAWVQLGGTLDLTTTRSVHYPRVIVDTSNRPIVSWTELDFLSNQSQYHIKRWNGTGWDTLLSPVNPVETTGSGVMWMAPGVNNSFALVWRQYGDSTDHKTQLWVKRFE